MHKNQQITVQKVPQIACSHFPEYSAQKIKTKQTFGMTNITLKISQQQKPSLLFRLLSPVIDRKYQKKVLQKIVQKGLCPKTLYACEQYRIQEFIQNAQSPTTQQINKNPQLLKDILGKLYQLHQIKLPKQLHRSFFDDVVFTEQRKKKYQSSKCQQAQKQSQQSDKQNKNKIQKQFKELKNQLLKDFQNVHQKIKKQFHKRKSHMKLTHNDANNNNIFIIKDKNSNKNKILLLDFQYACFSYPAYDIANLLKQCCIEYSEKMPGFNVYKKVNQQEINRACEVYPGKYEGIEQDVLFFLSICNYFWALWSLQAKPTQNFSPIQHGKTRLELYKFYSDKISTS